MRSLVFLIVALTAFVGKGFPVRPERHALIRTSRVEVSLRERSNNQEEQTDSTRFENGIEKSLLFPAINLRKESILFGDNPATREDSNALRAWRFTKRSLPFVLTGARTATTADDNPIAGFYNMIFVRIPTILAGVVYAKNLTTGHPLIIDVGSGPTEVSPLIVGTILFFILR